MTESRETPFTVLVVDDEELVRSFVSTLLRQTYNVLVAASAEEALSQARAHDGPIHLLLSNVQMPGMNGLELGTRLNLERPEMRVMLMSGFSSGLLILNEGWHFLHKPFMPTQLRDLISNVLAKENPETPNLEERRHSATS